MGSEAVLAVRNVFSIEDPWRSPVDATPVRLRRSTDGEAPVLATSVVVSYDDDYLSVLFSAADDHVVATYTAYGDPLYEEDVFEVFLAPQHGTEYYEIEVSPIGTIFDARIESPEGSRNTMRVDHSWASGAQALIRKVSEKAGITTIDTLLRIPFASLGTTVPSAGDVWRVNFYRIDRHPERGDEYTAWRPTLKTPPDFHVPAAFGALEFQAAASRSRR